MNTVNAIRERPLGNVAKAGNLDAKKIDGVKVSPAYYDAFLALTEDEMEILARAVLHVQADEARRLTRAESTIIEASTELTGFADKTLSLIAVGLARFNHFAQLELLKRVGPEPEPAVHDALMEKIAKARPIVEWAAGDFVQNLIDDGKPMTP
jgi:hypothetical protein